MKTEWDEAKNQKNIAKHGVHFDLAFDFYWKDAWVEPDVRDYGEYRFIASGFIQERLYIMIFTMRNDALRIIAR